MENLTITEATEDRRDREKLSNQPNEINVHMDVRTVGGYIKEADIYF